MKWAKPCVCPLPLFRAGNLKLWRWQVLGASLEAHVAASDNSALAKDCRRDIKAANAALLKLSRKVSFVTHSHFFHIWCNRGRVTVWLFSHWCTAVMS